MNAGVGLEINSGQLKTCADDLAGEGLEANGDVLDVVVGDGLEIVDGAITLCEPAALARSGSAALTIKPIDNVPKLRENGTSVAEVAKAVNGIIDALVRRKLMYDKPGR